MPLALGEPGEGFDIARDAFRETLPLDEAAWARGRGWALSVAVTAIPYYERTNPALAAAGRRSIDAVLADP